MGCTTCTETQCLYKGALYLYLYVEDANVVRSGTVSIVVEQVLWNVMKKAAARFSERSVNVCQPTCLICQRNLILIENARKKNSYDVRQNVKVVSYILQSRQTPN